MDQRRTVGWLEELEEQEFDGEAFGACTTNTFSLSDNLGNSGYLCTITVECQNFCS